MTPPSPASSSAPTELPALRALRLTLIFGLVLILTFFLALVLLSVSADLRHAAGQLFTRRTLEVGAGLHRALLIAIAVTPLIPFLLAWRFHLRSWRLLLTLPVGIAVLASGWLLSTVRNLPGGWVSLLTIGIVTALLFFLTWRLRRLRWHWVGIAFLTVAPIFAYLVADDATLRHPTTLEEIAPAFPGAEKSFEVLMRYGKNHPLGRNFKSPDRIWRTQPGPPKTKTLLSPSPEWRTWLFTSRAAIEADWEDLTPVRAWWDELNTFDRIGDLTPARLDADVPAFQPIRTYGQRAILIAGLQALDGNGDAAFETLLPLLEVSRKLESSARTLVRFMIARVSQQYALDAATFVLDHANVSPALRARFAAALTGGSSGEAGARRILAIEYAASLGWFGDLHRPHPNVVRSSAIGWISAARFLHPLVFNPTRTLNLYGDLSERLQDHAARREPHRIPETMNAFFHDEARPRFKNFAGLTMLREMVPTYSQMVENYWKIEDARVALHTRLTQM